MWHSRPGCVRTEAEIKSASAQDSRGRLSHMDATGVRGPIACPAHDRRMHAPMAAERANFQSFCNEFCDLLAVPRAGLARRDEHDNACVYDKTVWSDDGDANCLSVMAYTGAGPTLR